MKSIIEIPLFLMVIDTVSVAPKQPAAVGAAKAKALISKAMPTEDHAKKPPFAPKVEIGPGAAATVILFVIILFG